MKQHYPERLKEMQINIDNRMIWIHLSNVPKMANVINVLRNVNVYMETRTNNIKGEMKKGTW